MKILIAVLVATAVVGGALALTVLRQRDTEQNQPTDQQTVIDAFPEELSDTP
jgi:Flp pilus assembly protein protease CpaA